MKTTVETIASDLLPNNLEGNTGFAAFHDRHPNLMTLGDRAKSDVLKLLDLPYVWASFGLFIATGIKFSA